MGKANVVSGDTIKLHYKLSSPNGTMFENTFDDEPIDITLGQNDLAQNLEHFLIGLPPRERHVFMLDPAQAFGCRDEGLIQRIPLSEFPATIKPEPKAMIEFQMPNGTSMPGVILEIGASDVMVDFNHPLADCPVVFEAEILEIS